MRRPLLLVAFCALQIIAQDPQEATPPPKRLGKSKRVVDNRKVASFGLSPVAADPAKLKPSAARPAAASGALQAKVDLRPFMTEVEDQSQSNSCAANAVAGAYEYLAKRAALAAGEAEFGDISRLFIYYVLEKDVMECSGPEAYVKQLVENGPDLRWLPVGRAMLVEQAESDNSRTFL